MWRTITAADKKNCRKTQNAAGDREGPSRGFVIGRNDEGERVIANVEKGADTLSRMIREDIPGLRGQVQSQGEINLFTL